MVLPLNAAGWGKDSLEGLTVFSVSVSVESGCAKIITADPIRTDVELKLRAAGLSIKEKAYLENGGGDLLVSVGCVAIVQTTGRTISWAADFIVAVHQGVTLPATHKSLLADTWSIGAILVGMSSVIENNVRNSIRDSVDGFLNDYLTVNPKK